MESAIGNEGVFVTRVENGFIIHVNYKPSAPDGGLNVLGDVMTAFSSGEDPGEALKKVMSKQSMLQKTRRKPVETYVAKNLDELMRILLEIFQAIDSEASGEKAG